VSFMTDTHSVVLGMDE